MLTADQEASIRFAYRVYSTGNTYGAPASAVQAANDLIDKVVEGHGSHTQIVAQDFSRAATSIINKGN